MDDTIVLRIKASNLALVTMMQHGLLLPMEIVNSLMMERQELRLGVEMENGEMYLIGRMISKGQGERDG